MGLLKLALTIPSALILLDYSKKAGKIILAVDVSLVRWGEVLIQLV